MIVRADIKGARRFADDDAAIAELVDMAMNELAGEERGEGRPYGAGEDAWFYLSENPVGRETVLHASSLRVAVNRNTGYGALIWFAAQGFERSGGVYDHVWISDNPEPPEFDPRVVSDPCYPLFHDPSSTLPLAQVRNALEEFCRMRTGRRPECIAWTKGEANGRRLDRPPIVEFVEDPEIDWDLLR